LSKEVLFVAFFATLLVIAMPVVAWCIVQIESTYSVGFPPWHIWALGFHLLGLLLGLPSVYLAFRSRFPLRSLRTLLAQTDGASLDPNQAVLTQLAAMSLQPQQMVFSQGLGFGSASVNLMATAPEEPEVADRGGTGAQPRRPGDVPEQRNTFQPPFPFNLPQVPSPESILQNATRSPQNVQTPRALPWQDLACFDEQVRRLLGRTGTGRALPPTHMPHGDMHAFLSGLQSTTSQLGIGVSELQTSLLDGGASPEQLQNFATALETAGRALTSAAAAVHGSARNEGRQAASGSDIFQRPAQEAPAPSIFLNTLISHTPQADSAGTTAVL
jgi:hypothetical protein